MQGLKHFAFIIAKKVYLFGHFKKWFLLTVIFLSLLPEVIIVHSL